jgi:PIN domain nuclease of toxin-antitoxin system
VKVFDASALLALVFDEPGADRAGVLMADDDAVVSAANQAEFMTRLLDVGMAVADVDAIAASLPVTVLPLTPQQARAAALLRPATRHLGRSLGDRCCLALAQERGVEVVTADRPWQGLAGHRVTLIR